MKSGIFLQLLLLTFNSFAQLKVGTIQSFQPLKGISIRALEVRNDSTVWFAANRGVWGYTEDAGKTWHIDSIKVDTLYPEFRSMAVLDDSTVLLLSIASPAYLFKTTNKGKTWKLVYSNIHKDIFFDSMKFWNTQNGLALADPINGKIQMIHTVNGGDNWKVVDRIPVTYLEKGESFFAASNTCFDLDPKGYHSWIATGGKNSRVLHSPNGGGKHFSHDTPLPEGEQMTGIYSIDFYNTKIGAVGGGNYDKADTSIAALAITWDGGKTWKEVKATQPVFGSCVQFLNKDELYVTGTPGTFHYHLQTETLTAIYDSDGYKVGFHTLRVSPSGKVVWLAGGNGGVGMIKMKE